MALRLLALTFAAGLTLLAPPGSLAAKGPKPALCPGGSFRVTGGTLLGGTPEVITISNSQLSVVGICPAVSVRPKARKKFTVVSAKWAAGCGSVLAGKVTLTAKIVAPDCTVLKAVLRAKKAKLKRSFEARLSPSGTTTTTLTPTRPPIVTTTTSTTSTTTTMPGGVPCPSNPAGGPNELDLTVSNTGTDLDYGWTGTSHNLPVVGGWQLNLCLTECDSTTNPVCTMNGPTGVGSINTGTFGPPLPLLAANVPVCVTNRFKQDVTGTTNLETGDVSMTVDLFSDVFLTTAGEVCPRCNNNTCTSGPNQGRSCTVDGTVFVVQAAGDKTYNVSRDCPPSASTSQFAGSLPIHLPLTSGSASLVGPKPCKAQPGDPSVGVPVQDDQCGGSACNATCTGLACQTKTLDGKCIDSKGGLSQVCCVGDTTRPCFPTDTSNPENAGTIERTGVPMPVSPPWNDSTFPKTSSDTVVSVFCIPATTSNTVNTTSGLPGPGALILPATVVVRKAAISGTTSTTIQATTTTSLLPPTTSTTTTTTTSTTTTTTGPCAACTGGVPRHLSFTTTVGTGTCGHLDADGDPSFFSLACGGLYFGGAGVGVPLPSKVPDRGSSITKASCVSGTTLALTGTTPSEAGGNRCTQGALSKFGTSCVANSDCASGCAAGTDCTPGGACTAGACSNAKCALTQCTNAGCLFGPPLPIPNSSHAGAATSTCVVNTITADASGTGDCNAGSTRALNVPLSSGIFLNGDLMAMRCSGGATTGANCTGGGGCGTEKPCAGGGTCVNDTGRCRDPDAPNTPCCSDLDCPLSGTCETGACVGGAKANLGCITDADCPDSTCKTFIQPCPICNSTSNKCNGGINDGLACTPGDSAIDGDYPTSHDCPPPAASSLGALPIAFVLDSGTVTKTAVDLTDQSNVFCSYCKNKSLNAFARRCGGSPTGGVCTGNTGTTGAPCSPAAPCLPIPCTSNADCAGQTQGAGGFKSCGQRTSGAFTNTNTARTIVEAGSPSGPLTVGGPGAPSTLVSIFCIPLTFSSLVDAAADLPGPGAVAITGTARALGSPGGAFLLLTR